MSIREAETLARRVYVKWESHTISTTRARSLLQKLPHCECVEMVWNAISYFA